MDPFVTYFGKGYQSHTRNVLDIHLNARQKLNFLAKGLSAQFKVSYFSDFQENRTRHANFAYYVPLFWKDVPLGGTQLPLDATHADSMRIVYENMALTAPRMEVLDIQKVKTGL